MSRAKQPRPALIVFCREPIEYQVKTRLLGSMSPAAAAALSDAFIRDALAKAASVRPARIVIAASAVGGIERSKYFQRLARRYNAELIDQGGGSLGRRMARALELFSSSGAMLIGTDTPSLPAALLDANLGALRRTRVVIAPSLDGGYYAVGVRGALPPIFTAIRWGTSSVFASTVKRLKRAGIPYALGPAWYDVDRWADVMLLAAHLRMLARMRRRAVSSPCPATESVLQRLGVLRHDR
ncbi:MAG TPA: TIGR04282 family arsenosugar biosynthesis glycosyltransferase [Candidatus Acidoferrales bacterium]|nr:TIGR04282 family arsenosugar biosynthesis glycosyltransferase [Candidatus Acidoferrum sp.]HXN13615.1 TIGR04282 family arsenosugar biosynthesis glycosyltransferase [Candidatus Acidoferrales bacterium]